MSGDGADCVLNAVICAMREAFSNESSFPPVGGGTDKVRVFAGDAAPLSAVDMHIDECGCGNDPFIWVRLMRRYRTLNFPQPYVGDNNCGGQKVIAVEVGVARCAAVFSPDGCDWTAYEAEAETSLDDSWRVELALCRASAKLKQPDADGDICSELVALDAVIPYGPEGGVYAWIGTLYASA